MNNLLSIALSAAVPLYILQILERGGISDEDIQKASKVSDLLGEKGDRLLFEGKRKGETADVFNQTAYAIAVLSFCPGGVTVFGSHWEAEKFKTMKTCKSSPNKKELK